jgi:hypothetical protein
MIQTKKKVKKVNEEKVNKKEIEENAEIDASKSQISKYEKLNNYLINFIVTILKASCCF